MSFLCFVFKSTIQVCIVIKLIIDNKGSLKNKKELFAAVFLMAAKSKVKKPEAWLFI